MLDLEQTHTAFPVLTYFPETHADHSWVATVGSLLDTAALLFRRRRRRRAILPGRREGPDHRPRLRHAADRAHRPRRQRPARPAPRPSPSSPTRTDPAPAEVAVTARRVRRRRWRPWRPILASAPDRRDERWRRFAVIRSAYEPAIRALAGLTAASPAPWTTDRPADVGRPRFLRRRPLHVDWSVRRRRPRRPGNARYRWLKPPDSSLVMDTLTGWRSKCAIDVLHVVQEERGQSRLTPWRTRMRWTETSETDPVKG